MIKVLYISDNLKQRFGVTSVIMNYLELIPDENVKIDLLVYEGSEPQMVEKAKRFGAYVFFMPELGLKSIRDYCDFMRSFFGLHHYDIIHSHFNQIDSIVFPIARKAGVKKCISHSHNTKLSDNRLKSIRNRVMCWNIGWNADVLAACSEKAGEALFGKRFKNSKKKLIIRNGVNIERFRFDIDKRNEIRSSLNIEDDVILLGHVGSFKIQKNQTYLINIIENLIKTNKNYKLVFVGDGETKKNIEEEVKNKGLCDYVIFAGVRSDVDKILSAIDIFVLPSLYEGLPVIGIEAQAAGLQCLFADTITKEVDLTGQTFLELKDDCIEWVNAIISAQHTHHMEYADEISNRGYNIIIESKKLKEKYKALTE